MVIQTNDNCRNEMISRSGETLFSLFRSGSSLAARLASSPTTARQQGIDFFDPTAVQTAVRNVIGMTRN